MKGPVLAPHFMGGGAHTQCGRGAELQGVRVVGRVGARRDLLPNICYTHPDIFPKHPKIAPMATISLPPDTSYALQGLLNALEQGHMPLGVLRFAGEEQEALAQWRDRAFRDAWEQASKEVESDQKAREHIPDIVQSIREQGHKMAKQIPESDAWAAQVADDLELIAKALLLPGAHAWLGGLLRWHAGESEGVDGEGESLREQVEHMMSKLPAQDVSQGYGFQDFMNGRFRLRRGELGEQKGLKPSQKKLCFYATDQALLSRVLYQLSLHPRAWAVKFSTYEKGGMYLGRAFLMDEELAGVMWRRFKKHPSLFCAVQDDDWTLGYRGG